MRLEMRRERGKVVAQLRAGEQWAGYPGILHGGALSAIFDDVMGAAVNDMGVDNVTGRLEIWFRKPIPLGETITVTGEVTGNRGRVYETRGEAFLADGSLAAEASATFIQVASSFLQSAPPAFAS